MQCCDRFENFKEQETKIKEYLYWMVLVKQQQPTLGSLLLVPTRHSETMAELGPEEYEELHHIIFALEPVLTELFKCKTINYYSFMRTTKHPFFHVVPEYDHEQSFQGMKFGSHVNDLTKLETGITDPAIIAKLCDMIKAKLK